MKVGSLVFATDSGLGVLAKSFVDAGVVTDVMVVRHGKHPDHTEWYPGAEVITNLHDGRILDWCKSMDVMLFFETPFVWPLIPALRQHGTKTALMVMHECTHKNAWTHLPDIFLCPSALDLNVVHENVETDDIINHVTNYVKCQIPVNVPWRQRTKAEVFVHNSGHGGLKGRNGTAELLQAMRLVKSPAKLILRSQDHHDWPPYPELLGKVELTTGTIDSDELYRYGDVFIFPEKFNGLSLPLQEARAAGMLVMCGDRFPMNTWLPDRAGKDIIEIKNGDYFNPLIPVKEHKHDQRIGPPYQSFDEAVFDPRDIAAKIDEVYGRDFTEYSLQGKQWAESMSWETLRPRYMEVLENLCHE